MNLLLLARQTLGSDFGRRAGRFLGESVEGTRSAVDALLPTVLGAVCSRGASPQGAAGLLALIDGVDLDPSALGNLARLFDGNGSAIDGLLEVGTQRLAPSLFDDKTGPLVAALASSNGIKLSSAASLLALVVPLVLTMLKRLVDERRLRAGSLATLLWAQGPSLRDAFDSRLVAALGQPSPAAFLARLDGSLSDATRPAAASDGRAAAAAAARAASHKASRAGQWLQLLAAAAAALVLWHAWNRLTPPALPGAAPSAPAAPAAGFPYKVYFEAGSTAVGKEGGKAVLAAADEIKKYGLRVAITSNTVRAGDVATNEALAKARAQAVRARLLADGVAAEAIDMRPPLFVDAATAGSEAEARRVEIVNL